MKWFFAIGSLLVLAMWTYARVTIPPDDTRGRTVIYWSTDNNPARPAQVAPFEEANPDIHVKIEPNTFDKTIVQCSTGVGPDLIEIYGADDMVAYAEAGILLDLTPFAEEYGIQPEVTYTKLQQNLVFQDRQYRFPANAASQVLFFNKKKFDEAGVPYPTDNMTWPELIELLKPLTVKREGGLGYEQFGLLILRNFIRDIPLQFGGRFFNEDRTRCTIDEPKFIDGMKLYRALMTEHELIPTPEAAGTLTSAGAWGAGEITWFRAQRSAALWGSRWMLVTFRQSPELHKHLGVVTLPRIEGGVPASYSGTRGPGINVNSKNREAALKFLSYLGSDEYAKIIAMSADALPPNAEYGSDPDNLLNPEYPEENYQEAFIKSMEYAEPIELSPFVNPKFVWRVWEETLDYISNGLKTPEEACREAAKRINDEMDRTLRNRPDLKEQYDRLNRD
jgi:multiple sugar transport system substrate-binding protein